MQKRRSYEIKKKILQLVKEKPLSYSELERKVNTGYRTITDNCKELERFGKLIIETIEKHPKNKKPSYCIKITKEGIDFLKKES